jgi:N-acyl-D-aspartate/D-glutamate deacylase
MRRRIAGMLIVAMSGAALAFGLMSGRLARAQQAAAAQSQYDIVIRNGHIIDGTGSPWYAGDIGIRDGRIAAIGNLSRARAKREIDAAGRVVAPGFIDMLGQSEITMLVDPHVPSKIFQGITTEITGEGDTVGPQTDATLTQLKPQWGRLRCGGW